MDKPTCSKRKYTFKVIVEIENGGWPESDKWPYLPKSDAEVREGVRSGILSYEYGDVWGFKNVKVEEMPTDILNTAMKDVKVGTIEEEQVHEKYECFDCKYTFAVKMYKQDYIKMIDKRLYPFCPHCGKFIEGSKPLNYKPDEQIKYYEPLSLSWHHI